MVYWTHHGTEANPHVTTAATIATALLTAPSPAETPRPTRPVHPTLATPEGAPAAAAAARRGELPAPRPIPWLMKPLGSAETTHQLLPDGRQRLTIKHDVIKGVTPAMLHWWFTHIRGEMTVDGAVYERYLAWHPLDHIHWSHTPAPDGTAGAGAHFQIVEALGRDPRHLIFVEDDEVIWSSEEGFQLAGTRFGLRLSRMTHRFTPVPGGTQYDSELIVGVDLPVLGPLLNRYVRSRLFTEPMARAWLKHNVEEVGNFERFLPQLYASETGS